MTTTVTPQAATEVEAPALAAGAVALAGMRSGLTGIHTAILTATTLHLQGHKDDGAADLAETLDLTRSPHRDHSHGGRGYTYWTGVWAGVPVVLVVETGTR